MEINNKNASSLLSFILPTFGNILWVSTFFLVLSRGRHMINADGDFALHLNIGKYILAHKEIPLRDLFSYTMTGQPVTQHEWLTTVTFALFDKYFGLTGVIVFCAVVIATTFWLLVKHIRNESQILITSFLVAFLVMIISMTHWLVRPHLVTFLLLTLWMIVLQQIRSGKLKVWWTLPLIMVFWVNLHGGFITGFIYWFIYGIGMIWDVLWQRVSKSNDLPPYFWRYYILSGVSAFVVSLLNPSGINLWKKIIFHVGNRYLADFTLEFRSPNFHWFSLWPVLFFIALLLITLGYHKKKIESGLLFNAIAWLIMGLYSGRNIPLFAIVASPLVTLGLDELLLQSATKLNFIKYFINLDARIISIERKLAGFFWPLIGMITAFLGLLTGYKFDYQKLGYEFDPEVFPIAAVNWLEKNPQEGNMLNFFSWGGYLEYRLWPQKQVFIDSKSDFFGEQFVRQYDKVINVDEGWESVLEIYNVDWSILPSDSLTARIMQIELDWKKIYEDETSIILRRE